MRILRFLERIGSPRRQGGWIQYVWYVVTLILSVLLAPKPPKPKPAALEDFDIPVAEEDRPIPVLFGTVRITGANITDYGDLSVKRIKKSSLFSSQTVGFEYYLGMHVCLCHGPIDEISRIEAGEKIAWTGSVTSSSTITINEPELFGGEKREGGMRGRLDVEMGEPTQTVNDYLSGTLHPGQPVPAFIGTVGLVWRTGTVGGVPIFGSGFGETKIGWIGNTPYVKPWAVTCRRILKGWTNDTPWYPEAAEIGDDMNPAHIIYQSLTDVEWGQGSPVAQLDDDAFREAADTLVDEGFGLSMLWNQVATLDEFIQIVLDHIAGVLTFDHTSGKYILKLIRADFDFDELPIFDPSNIVRLERLERRSWGETVNELTIGYTDPDTFKVTNLTVQDTGNIAAQGVRVAETVSFSAIRNHDLAKVVAGRELNARSTPLARLEFTTNRVHWQEGAGSAARFTWPERGIEDMVIRILKCRRGTLEQGSLRFEAVEDIFSLGGIEYQVPQSPPASPTIPPTPDDDTVTGPSVISATTSTPPDTGNVDGDTYLIPLTPPATGAWAGHEGELAIWDDATGTWSFSDPPEGVLIWVEDEQRYIQILNGVPEDPPFSVLDSPEVHTAGKSTADVEIIVDSNGQAELNPLLSNSFYMTLEQDTELNVLDGLSGQVITLVIIMGTSSGPVLDFTTASNVMFAQGEPYEPTAAPNAVDHLSLRWVETLSAWLVTPVYAYA